MGGKGTKKIENKKKKQNGGKKPQKSRGGSKRNHVSKQRYPVCGRIKIKITRTQGLHTWEKTEKNLKTNGNKKKRSKKQHNMGSRQGDDGEDRVCVSKRTKFLGVPAV